MYAVAATMFVGDATMFAGAATMFAGTETLYRRAELLRMMSKRRDGPARLQRIRAGSQSTNKLGRQPLYQLRGCDEHGARPL
jgi:hypothetical protein